MPRFTDLDAAEPEQSIQDRIDMELVKRSDAWAEDIKIRDFPLVEIRNAHLLAAYLQMQLHQERQKSARLGLALMVMTARAGGESTLLDEEIKATSGVLVEFRSSDVEGDTYVLVVPKAPEYLS